MEHSIERHGTFDRASGNIRSNVMEHSIERHGTFEIEPDKRVDNGAVRAVAVRRVRRHLGLLDRMSWNIRSNVMEHSIERHGSIIATSQRRETLLPRRLRVYKYHAPARTVRDN